MKKNIVFIQCDSMDGRIMGCMGHPAMGGATPNLDKLARRGTMFKNTYSNSPLCCPSRASMWSGQYVHHCEAWNNYEGLLEDMPTFKNHMENSGYEAGIFGKTDYLAGYHTIRARVSAWTGSANIGRPNYHENYTPEILDGGEARVHERHWKIIDESIEWLQEAVKGDKPVMLYTSVNSPHPKFITSDRYIKMIDESGVNIPLKDVDQHPAISYQRICKNWAFGFSDEVVKKVRRIYFAMIAETDAMIGKLLDALDELGITDSTYVVFCSDHGEMAMEHEMYYKGNMYEPSARVPLIIAGPGLQKGAMVEELASLVDIFPTLMDMAGIPHPEGLDGHSLMPELKGEKCRRPDFVVSEYHGETSNTSMFMVRQGYWKYIVYMGYKPMLFNLKDDPDEIYNLVEERADIAGKLDKLLCSEIDYEVVAAKVGRYNRESFDKWREEQLQEGTYHKNMSLIFSGFDNLSEDDIVEWTEKDEDIIEKWLNLR